MLLYLCGRFEYFVRQVIEALGDEIANRAKDYDSLPSSLRDELRRRTLDVAKSPARYGYSSQEADALIVGLATNLDRSQKTEPIMIDSKVLSVTESNMRANTLNEVMKRVGMQDTWKELGKQAKLKIYLQKQSDGECAAAAQRRLDDLMIQRNNIAHPTGGTSFPDPDQVLWMAGFLEELGRSLVELCQVHLSIFPAANGSTGSEFSAPAQRVSRSPNPAN
ncbi:HEPN domain-containing protein [Micromonospora sp. B9E7]|uniref:HEPN domain-containing protein n=1 Tax=Micromonospora sp. B9E7 TaxID=3153574 RepID=UPI00325DF98F